MLVDDSAVARSVFQRMLEPWPEFAVVATAASASQALDRLADVAVDIIVLDVEMPGVDGLTALPRLLERAGTARVLVVSSACAAGGAAAMRALTLGAADTLSKPAVGGYGAFAELLAETLRRIGAAADRYRPGEPAPQTIEETASPAPVLRAPISGPVACIAIGASTGGLHALSAFFLALPPEVAAPILITQHLPRAFMPYFAAQMRDIAGREAKVAEDGDRLAPGAMLIAPGDRHLGLVRAGEAVRVSLIAGPAPSGCTPSVDPMFDAVAQIYRTAGVGVVLSGMGRDGALGAARLAAAGGEVLAQDMASSVIWGMPGAVATAGHAAGVAPPDVLAKRIAARVGAGQVARPRALAPCS